MTSRITAGFLVLLVAAIYWISLNGTVAGDAQLLLSDSRIHAFTWENLGLIFSKSYYYGSVEQSVFRPVTTLSFLLTNAMLPFQARPWPDHLLNLLLHALNVLLVWLIAQAVWTRSPRAAEGPWFVQIASCFTAAIFAVHPVNAEAVANIAGRADLLAALGVLAGLAWHVRETPSPRGKGFAILLAAGLIGMFSKENAVLLPAAMLLYDLVFRSREEIRKLVHHYAGAGLALTVLLWVRFLLVAGWFNQAHPFLDNP